MKLKSYFLTRKHQSLNMSFGYAIPAFILEQSNKDNKAKKLKLINTVQVLL